MSAAEHREHARAEDEQAAAHEAQYDPDAEHQTMVGSTDSTFAFDIVTYNPTEGHREEASAHREHGAAHRKAAAALERFEEAECAQFPPSTRGVCPLIGQVAGVENVADGVQITIADRANREAIVAHARCHLAFAATHGFEGMPTCPLYVKGVSIQDQDGKLRLRVDESEDVGAVQRRTAAHVK